MIPANKLSRVDLEKLRRKQEDLSELFYAEIKRLQPSVLEGLSREHQFHETRKWRFDFAWPSWNVAVECDGGQFKAMGGRHNTDKDRDKINTATQMGWMVFRFSGNQIKTDPMGCIEMVRKALLKRVEEAGGYHV